MLIEDENKHSVLSSRAKGAADGAPHNRRLGSARCWSDPDSARAKETDAKTKDVFNFKTNGASGIYQLLENNGHAFAGQSL